MRMIALLAASGLGSLLLASPARAQQAQPSAEDLRQVLNLPACYVEGVDAIGGGRGEEGKAIWSRCFEPDFAFHLSLGPTPTECPGPQCSLPPGNSIDRRVIFAQRIYGRMTVVATSHHITTPMIEWIDATTARLKGHLQAWHWAASGAVTIGLGTWEIRAHKTPQGWRIVDEKLASPNGVRIPAPPAAPPRTAPPTSP